VKKRGLKPNSGRPHRVKRKGTYDWKGKKAESGNDNVKKRKKKGRKMAKARFKQKVEDKARKRRIL